VERVIALGIEASTYAGSVALVRDGRVVGERTVAMRGREHEALMPAVAEVLAEAGLAPAGLDAVVCGAGPGAFTSLRIAGGIAKGIALSAGVPLLPVSSLALVIAAKPLAAGAYLVAIDAMRGEHYVQRYYVGADGSIEAAGGAGLLATSAVASAATAVGATVVGPGQPGDADIAPHARGIARLTNMIALAGPADLASWEPAYGRLAEAQVKWEAEHGRPLAVS
jgi:tRNA threonylcarbamoyladenosine biosynthesis protein TsaB